MHSIVMTELLAVYKFQRRRERFAFHRARMAETPNDLARPLVRRMQAWKPKQPAI